MSSPKMSSIQAAIDIAIAEHCNVLIPCSLSNEELKASITDGRGCALFWRKDGELISIAHPDYMDSLGGAGPTIKIIFPGKDHHYQD